MEAINVFSRKDNLTILIIVALLFVVSINNGATAPIIIVLCCLLIAGNQQRSSFIAQNIYIRRMVYIVFLALPLIYNNNGLGIANYVDSRSSIIVFFIFFVFTIIYQAKENWSFICRPILVRVIYPELKNNKFLILFSLGVAILEELFFRYYISKFFIGYEEYFVFYSTLVFVLYHIAAPWGDSDFTKKDIANQFVFGFIFSVSYFLSGEIWMPIVLHVTFNIFSNSYRIIYEWSRV